MKITQYICSVPEKILNSIIPCAEIVFSCFTKNGRRYLRELSLERRDRKYYQKNIRDVHGPTKCDNF